MQLSQLLVKQGSWNAAHAGRVTALHLQLSSLNQIRYLLEKYLAKNEFPSVIVACQSCVGLRDPSSTAVRLP